MSQTKAQLIDPVDLSIVTADLADDAVTAAKLASNAVVNASVDASAAIAGTKISPDFGSQNIVTTGSFTGNDLEIDSGTLSVDASNNRVGIGTTSPSQKLEVSGNLKVSSGLALLDNDQRVQWGSSNVAFIEGNDNEKLVFGVAAENMRIDSAGSLLIGTTTSVDVASTAASLLQVEHGSGNISAAFYSTVDALGPSGTLALGHARGSATGALQADDVIGQIRFAGGDGTDIETSGAKISAEVDGSVGSNVMPGRLVFSTNAGTSTVTERMRIDSTGRLLVGTTDTPSKLTVDTDLCVVRSSSDPTINLLLGSSSSITQLYRILIDDSDSDKLQIRSGDTARVTMTTGGFVGIGTSSPSCGLHIDNPNDAAITQILDTDNTAVKLVFRNNTETGNNMQIGADGSNLVALTAATERMRIDSSGRLLLGTSTARAVGGESNPRLHLEGSGNTSNSWINLTRFQAGTGSANIQFAKARSNTPGTYTVVQDGDTLGQLSFLGADGTDMANYAAIIKAQVDGTPGSNDMPGRLVFMTTADGGTFPTERVRIDNDGKVGIGNTTPTNIFDGAGLKIEKYQQRSTSYASPDGYYGASLGEVTNSATKVWATVESHYAQANAVSAGIFLKAFHQDAGGSQCGFTIKNLKDQNDLTFSRVTTAASTGSPAVETERLRIRHQGGITFGGETAAANALDDYEEGTWTPNIFNAGSTSNWTAKDGNYQKIGNTVTVWFRCDGGTTPRSGASGGHLTITGLPFTLNGMDANTVLGIGAANFVSSGSEDCNVSTAGSGNPFIRQGGSNEAEQCNYFSAVFSYLTTQ